MFADLEGGRVLICGGTGFVGRAMISAARDARAEIVVLTRQASPSFDRAVQVIAGDVRTFEIDGPFSHIIHAGSATTDSGTDRREGWDVIVNGTRHVLDIAARSKARLLLVGSGAVYGGPPPGVDESFTGAPATTAEKSWYGEGKRAAEMLCTLYASDVPSLIARCFTFSGAGLALERSFAICIFLRAALAGGPIQVSEPATVRSYLDDEDMARWLWALLLRGTPLRPVNVGSPDPITMASLAELIRDEVAPNAPIELGAGNAPSTYVPSTARAMSELGVTIDVPLAESIRRMAAGHRLQSNHR